MLLRRRLAEHVVLPETRASSAWPFSLAWPVTPTITRRRPPPRESSCPRARRLTSVPASGTPARRAGVVALVEEGEVEGGGAVLGREKGESRSPVSTSVTTAPGHWHEVADEHPPCDAAVVCDQNAECRGRASGSARRAAGRERGDDGVGGERLDEHLDKAARAHASGTSRRRRRPRSPQGGGAHAGARPARTARATPQPSTPGMLMSMIARSTSASPGSRAPARRRPPR